MQAAGLPLLKLRPNAGLPHIPTARTNPLSVGAAPPRRTQACRSKKTSPQCGPPAPTNNPHEPAFCRRRAPAANAGRRPAAPKTSPQCGPPAHTSSPHEPASCRRRAPAANAGLRPAAPKNFAPRRAPASTNNPHEPAFCRRRAPAANAGRRPAAPKTSPQCGPPVHTNSLHEPEAHLRGECSFQEQPDLARGTAGRVWHMAARLLRPLRLFFVS